jgi:beta-glucosidase
MIGDFTKANVGQYGYTVTDGNVAAGTQRPSAAGHDVALISVIALTNRAVTGTYQSDDPATKLNPSFINPATGKP